MPSQYLQGKFQPQNPQKYMGNTRDIVYRSSWELIAFKFADMTPDIVKWSSENTIIPYRGVDGLMHRYFVDLQFYAKQADGSMKRFLVEIKPKSKRNMPVMTAGKKPENFKREMVEYLTNQAKWNAAEEFCKQHGAVFVIWDEDTLMPQMQRLRPKKKTPTIKRRGSTSGSSK